MSDTQEVVIDPAAAPDAATAAANVAAAEDKAAGKTVEQIEEAAAAAREEIAKDLSKVKPKYYVTVHGGVMIDPETNKEFSGEGGTKSPLTNWLDFQIKNGKIVEEK